MSDYLDETMFLFKVNNPDESLMVQEQLFGYGFRWASGQRYVNVLEYPSYIFARVFGDNKELTYYNIDSSGYDVEVHLDRYYDEYNHLYFKAEDANHMNTILKLGIIKPTYKPKKVKRIYESSAVNIMFVYMEDYDDTFNFQNYLQDLGYTWHSRGELDIINDFDNNDLFIFKIDIPNKDIIYASFHYHPDSSDYKDRLLLYYPKDFDKIKNIIKFNRTKPTYKPKKIKKFESFSYENLKNKRK